MSKAQTDVVAALRIELDDTKAALAKANARTKRLADDALVALAGARIATPEKGYLVEPHCLENDIKTLARERNKAEGACAALTESLAALCKYAHEDRAQTPGFTRLARGILHAESLLASPNPGEGWVSPETIAQRDAEGAEEEKHIARLVEQRDSLRERLGDAERVIEAARELGSKIDDWLCGEEEDAATDWNEKVSEASAKTGYALAEFDAKWGKQ